MPHPLPPDDARPAKPLRIWIEDALILLAIPVLWLTILRFRGPIYTAVMLATLAVMVWIFVARWRRLNKYVEEHKKTPPRF